MKTKSLVSLFMVTLLLIPSSAHCASVSSKVNSGDIEVGFIGMGDEETKDFVYLIENYSPGKLTDFSNKIIEKLVNLSSYNLSDLKNSSLIWNKIVNAFGNTSIGNFLKSTSNLIGGDKTCDKTFRYFIISRGYGKRFDLRLLPKIKIYKFMTVWWYRGFKKFMKESVTKIFDRSENYSRIILGSQMGVMFNFVGIYIKLTGTMFHKDRIFFIGFAKRVWVLDLPDLWIYQKSKKL